MKKIKTHLFLLICCLFFSTSLVSQEKSSNNDYDIDFHIGLGYSLQNEFSTILYYGNYINSYSLLHGFSINSSVSVFSDKEDKIGFIGGFGIGMPNSLFSWFNKDRKENFTIANSYFTGVMINLTSGVQFRHFLNEDDRIESAVCGKVGYYHTAYKYGENYSEKNANFNVLFGISGKVNYLHYFNEKYGISAGIYVDYDFISLAQLVSLANYKAYGQVDLFPFVCAVIKF